MVKHNNKCANCGHCNKNRKKCNKATKQENDIKRQNQIIYLQERRKINLEKKREYNEIYRERAKTQKQNDSLLIERLAAFINQKYGDRFTKPKKSRRHSLATILEQICYFIKVGISYQDYRGPLSKSTLNSYIQLFSQDNIFVDFYWTIHEEYLRKDMYDKFKYISTDTSFIMNHCSAYENVARNPCVKNKNCVKLSLLVDAKGVPLDIKTVKGNQHDSPLLREHFQEIKSKTNSLKMSKNNRYKPYFLADKGYDSKESTSLLKSHGYSVIIPKNKKNAEEEPSKMTPKEKIIYNKRIIVENVFANLKQFRRVGRLYDKDLKIYVSNVHLALSKLLLNKI